MDPYYVTDLKSGTLWPNNQVGVTLNFMFFTQSPPYYTAADYEHYNFQSFTASMKTAVYDVLAQLSSFANVTFNEVFSLSQKQIGFGQSELSSDAEAWTYYPDAASPSPNAGGDVWANSTYFEYLGSPPQVAHGDYDFMTLIHEIGHALGLKHSFEGHNRLPTAEDTTQYTVMSYTDSPYYLAPGFFSSSYYQPESYMPYDIAALQSLYGANTAYHAGADTYTLLPDHIYTIWDGGGADTMDGSAVTASMLLDLRAGHYSNVAVTTTMSHNIAIAFGVTIENANGGSGNDTIYDNAASNVINGNGGNDTFYLTTGSDTVDGGSNTDTIVFSGSYYDFVFTGLDPVTVQGAAVSGGDLDTLTNVENFQFNDSSFTFAELLVGPPSLTLAGTIGNDILTGGIGADTITGDAGNDILYGLAGPDSLDGGLGNDRMYGGMGDDLYLVDNTRDQTIEIVGASSGYDVVDSYASRTLGAGLEKLILEGAAVTGKGNALNNDIIGNAAGNVLGGANGNDFLDGNGGYDVLTGGSGADTFMFHAATAYGAVDKVTDFKVVQGDVLDISDLLTGYDALTDSLSDFVQITVSGSGKGSVLSVDADGTGLGSTFTAVALLNAVSATSLPDVDTLVANGNLIVD